MVVVTSPMGDHAPPALVAVMIRLAYQILSLGSLISFRNKVINTMVAVRLSMIDERMKPRIPVIHNNFSCSGFEPCLLILQNPVEINDFNNCHRSNQKIRISAILPMWCNSVAVKPSSTTSVIPHWCYTNGHVNQSHWHHRCENQCKECPQYRSGQ